MITKGERGSRNPFEHDNDAYGEEGSNRPFSMGDSPPTYDDTNYIPSPTSVSRSNTAALLPLVVPQATGSSSALTTTSTGTTTGTTTSTQPMYLMSPDVASSWSATLTDLERSMAQLQAARTRAAQPKQSDAEEVAREVRALEGGVLGGMRRLALIHPDPRVQAEWHARAEAFMRTMSTYRPPPEEDYEDDEREGGSGSGRAVVRRRRRDGEEYKEESYTDPGHADVDDFIIDIDREGSRRSTKSKRSSPGGSGSGLASLHSLGGSPLNSSNSNSGASSSLGSKAKRMLARASEEDKGLSYIKKGTAGVFLAPIVISGALLYGTAALFYGAGKGAVHLGRKAAAAKQNANASSSSRAGAMDPTVPRSTSNPELVSPAKSTFKADVRDVRDF